MSETENQDTVVAETNFPEVALGVYRDMNLGEWIVVEIPYHPVTGAVGEFRRQATGKHREEASYRFKVKASELEII